MGESFSAYAEVRVAPEQVGALHQEILERWRDECPAERWGALSPLIRLERATGCTWEHSPSVGLRIASVDLDEWGPRAQALCECLLPRYARNRNTVQYEIGEGTFGCYRYFGDGTYQDLEGWIAYEDVDQGKAVPAAPPPGQEG